MKHSLRYRRAAAAIVVCCLAGHVHAQGAWKPDKNVEFVVGLTPGSSQDRTARVLQNIAQTKTLLGVNSSVVNRVGGGGNIAWNYLSQHAGDAHWLQIASPTILTNYIIGTANFTYTDFTPLALLGNQYIGLAVRADSPIKDLAGLIAAAKAKPDALNYGDAGGSPYLAAAMLNTTAGVRTTHVAYKGAAEALTEVLGGRLDYAPTSVSSATALLRAGQLRALAVTTSTRNPDFPDVPTVAELLPGYQAITWWGVVGPAGMPPAVTARLNEAIAGAIRDPAVKARLAAVGIDAVTGTPDEFSAFIVSEMQKWAPIVKATMAARRGS